MLTARPTGVNDGMTVAAALRRLNGLLPLKANQSRLASSLRKLHIAILRSYAHCGAPPSRAELERHAGIDDLAAALQRLADADLIVLTRDKAAIAGAYPFTSELRPYRVTLFGHEARAMCALDALSIAPMFDTLTQVQARCHVHGTPVEVHLDGSHVLATLPAQPYVGIHWQSTSGCAAQSLCMDMVFLRDQATAAAWRQSDPENIDCFDLADAIAFGAGFFRPLLRDG